LRILLTGPTAVGKTSVSIELAHQLAAEIISSDSRQCYKYLNVGTSTPTSEEQDGISHFNLSIIDPAEKDSAAKFCARAGDWEKEITERNHTVIYVGGSTLHQRCIIQSFDDIPSADNENVVQLKQQKESDGIESLYQKLREVDPKYATAMDGMNTQRIIRALDVWLQTGQPFSSFHSNGTISPPGDLQIFGLRRKRQLLYDRINERVERMFENGLIEEVQSLLDRGYSLDDPGLNTVGYKEVIAYLRGQLPRKEMVERIKTRTRRYAKRQLTYFRRWDFVNWIELNGQSSSKTAQEICASISK
jgi:tRNA dimethylallyltransferase